MKVISVIQNFLHLDVTVWPDPSLGLLGPKDVRMPLPGNVGFSQRLVPTPLPLPIRQPLTESGIWTTQTNYERQIQILKQSAANEDEIEEISQEDIDERSNDFTLVLSDSSRDKSVRILHKPKLKRGDVETLVVEKRKPRTVFSDNDDDNDDDADKDDE